MLRRVLKDAFGAGGFLPLYRGSSIPRKGLSDRQSLKTSFPARALLFPTLWSYNAGRIDFLGRGARNGQA
jgi:hypothetical protein